jgi:hypothetical protein
MLPLMHPRGQLLLLQMGGPACTTQVPILEEVGHQRLLHLAMLESNSSSCPIGMQQAVWNLYTLWLKGSRV